MMLDYLLWPVLALLAAITQCGSLMVSHILKVRGQYTVFWLRILVLAASFPILFFIPAPEDIRFYIAVGLTGIIAGFADIQVINVTIKRGGAVVSRVLPFQIFIIFVMWLCVHPEQVLEYMARPLHTFGILGALSGCVYFSSHMRKCNVSNAALKQLMLPMFGYAANFVLAKYAFDISDFHSGVYYYILVQTAVQLPVLILLGLTSKHDFIRYDRKFLFSMQSFKPGIWMFLFWMLHMISKNYANTLTPNPSYVAALVMTAPAWMVLIYKLRGEKDDADTGAGIGLMISAIVLSLLNIK